MKTEDITGRFHTHKHGQNAIYTEYEAFFHYVVRKYLIAFLDVKYLYEKLDDT